MKYKRIREHMSGEGIKALIILFHEVIQYYLKAHCEMIKHIVILIDGETVFDVLMHGKKYTNDRNS